ncbi:MAG: M48 family metallopeptidase [Isosphaeraceae bacterium]
MSGGSPRSGLACPGCGAELRPPGPGAPDLAELACPRCGGSVRLRRREGHPVAGPARRPPEPPQAGGLGLVARCWALRALEGAYTLGQGVGLVVLLAAGGFVPVLGRWLRDELSDWSGVVETLGGVRVETQTTDPDADFGPVIAKADAPALFTLVEEVARRVGVRPPGQIRLAYLPCCGVVAWGRGGRGRALMLGLPLLNVLSRLELRAVLAHELAHLAKGDATGAAHSMRFTEALGRALDAAPKHSRSPLRLWAQACRSAAETLLAPMARGQEARADRAAASIAGGEAAASALVKVALVQPIFREVLEYYDSSDPDLLNLYAFFRAFWDRMPDPLLTSLRHTLLADHRGPIDPAHPPLLDRLALVQSYPQAPSPLVDQAPSAHDLGDLEALEQMLHNRLFGLARVEPSVFHRAGS